MPSIEAMLITLAGFSAVAAARRGAASALVRKNGVLTLRFITLSQPLSGNSSKSAPHAAPALLTRISSFGSRFLISAASMSMPARVEISIGSATHSPPYSAVSSFAVASHGPALRAVMLDFRRALAEKSGCYHLADAARASGHQRDAALQRKQIFEHLALPWILSTVLV